MISCMVSRLVILVFGTLYPAYASYKAVKSKNVEEYVKLMMYWIVFALFTCAETITDIFLSWFPLYYEIKIVFLIWFLSPATKGSSVLYRKFVHPLLSSKEQEIDEYLSKAKEQSYKQVLELMQTSLKNLFPALFMGQPASRTYCDRVDGNRPYYDDALIDDVEAEEEYCEPEPKAKNGGRTKGSQPVRKSKRKATAEAQYNEYSD